MRDLEYGELLRYFREFNYVERIDACVTGLNILSDKNYDKYFSKNSENKQFVSTAISGALGKGQKTRDFKSLSSMGFSANRALMELNKKVLEDRLHAIRQKLG